LSDEEKRTRDQLKARDDLESYAYSLRDQIQDKQKLGGELSADDKAKIEEAIDTGMDWLEENEEAEASEFVTQKKEIEDIVQGILAKIQTQKDV